MSGTGGPGETYRKSSRTAPREYLPWEAAGLRWLGRVEGGARVARVVSVDEQALVLERLHPSAPTPTAAEAFGAGLARTHQAGAPAYGSPPDGWAGDGFLGPFSEPLPLLLRPVTPETGWGAFWADQRVRPLLADERLRRGVGPDGLRALTRVADRAQAGVFDTDDPPARLHGDLWAGNVLWTPRGAVLIDPAAHGGHRETDLAMLALFGCPHLDRIIGAYQRVRPLADGWEDRVALHQIHPLLLHTVLFGGSYPAQLVSAVRRYAGRL